VDDITDQPNPLTTNFTRHVPDEPVHPALAQPRSARGRNSLAGYVLVVLGVLALTVLLAVIGGYVLVGITAVIVVLGLIHYWTWGRSLSRKVAKEQAELFRRQLQVDRDHLSEIERPRHY
jgi:Flp pilus assembly protein TadB